MTMAAWRHALLHAADGWEAQRDDLVAAHRTLADADVALLGPRVGPVAASFVAGWATALRDLGDEAAAHAESLRTTAASFGAVDVETSEEMQRLLPWQSRDVSPVPTVPGSGAGR